MPANNPYRTTCLYFYLACFAVCYLLLFTGDLLLHQHQPVLFTNRLDFSLNLLLLTNIGNTVLNNYPLQLTLDVVYFLLPVCLLVSVRKNHFVQHALAFMHVLYNLFYTLLLSAVAPLSIHWFAGFMFVPLIFVVKNDHSFYFAIQSMRYIFLLLFFSAGLWKIRAGGIFNLEQMSAILVRQHTYLLLDAKANWYEQMLRFLIDRPGLSYSIYFAGTMAELSYVIGFFSKRYDRLLSAILVSFIILNFLFMQINYVSWLAFLCCLWFSNRTELSETLQRANKFHLTT